MSVLRRLRRVPNWLDVALAVVLFTIGESQVWGGWNDGSVGTVPHGHRLVRSLLVVGFVAPLVWRRRRPLVAVSVTCAAIGVQLLMVSPYVPFLAGLVPMAIGNYTAAAYAHRWRSASLLAVLGTELVIYLRIPEERVGGEVLFAIFVAVGTWVAGDVVRARFQRADETVREAESVLAETEAATARILADERARIARELHDVIAHSVSVMGVQAGAARSLMDADPDAAREALRAIESTARSSVDELKRLLAVLRDDEATALGREPQPGLTQLPVLVEKVRVAGLAIELSMPASTGLPPGVDLAAYRIVQEALTNALKHARAATVVDVQRHNGELRIEIRDQGPGSSPQPNPGGRGLVGMRERAALYGGTVDAGPHPEGGFVVRARIPVSTDGPS